MICASYNTEPPPEGCSIRAMIEAIYNTKSAPQVDNPRGGNTPPPVGSYFQGGMENADKWPRQMTLCGQMSKDRRIMAKDTLVGNLTSLFGHSERHFVRSCQKATKNVF